MRRIPFSLFSFVLNRLVGTRVAALIWRIPGAHAFYRALVPRLRPDRVTVDGHVFALDRMDSLLLSVNGNYEASEQALFATCIRAGDTVLDIGAHIGLYTMQAARAVGPGGRVVAFEPSSENYALLCSNVAANGYGNVTTEHLAVSSEAGEVALSLSVENTGDHSLVTERTAGRKVETVAAVTIDAYLAGDRVDVLKMDIQGAEPAALAGARATLDRCENLILFTELSPGHLAAWGGADAFLRQLVDCGFRLFEIGDGRLVEATCDELASRHAVSDGVHWDLVCVKGDGAAERLVVADAAVAG